MKPTDEINKRFIAFYVRVSIGNYLINVFSYFICFVYKYVMFSNVSFIISRNNTSYLGPS